MVKPRPAEQVDREKKLFYRKHAGDISDRKPQLALAKKALLDAAKGSDEIAAEMIRETLKIVEETIEKEREGYAQDFQKLEKSLSQNQRGKLRRGFEQLVKTAAEGVGPVAEFAGTSPITNKTPLRRL